MYTYIDIFLYRFYCLNKFKQMQFFYFEAADNRRQQRTTTTTTKHNYNIYLPQTIDKKHFPLNSSFSVQLSVMHEQVYSVS